MNTHGNEQDMHMHDDYSVDRVPYIKIQAFKTDTSHEASSTQHQTLHHHTRAII